MCPDITSLFTATTGCRGNRERLGMAIVMIFVTGGGYVGSTGGRGLMGHAIKSDGRDRRQDGGG